MIEHDKCSAFEKVINILQKRNNDLIEENDKLTKKVAFMYFVYAIQFLLLLAVMNYKD